MAGDIVLRPKLTLSRWLASRHMTGFCASSQHADSNQRAFCRPARWPNGQQRGWTSQHRCGANRPHGQHAHRVDDSEWRILSHPVLVGAMKNARLDGRQLHLFGLVSDGGVHSYQSHLHALLKMAKQNGVDRVFVHAFMDGRDTLPTNGTGYLELLLQKMREYKVGEDCQRKWSLLCDGPRSALGAHRQGIQGNG